MVHMALSSIISDAMLVEALAVMRLLLPEPCTWIEGKLPCHLIVDAFRLGIGKWQDELKDRIEVTGIGGGYAAAPDAQLPSRG
jgi:hypothetical protein